MNYFVPKNVSMRFEILPGFGMRELFLCGTALGFGGALALLGGILNIPAMPRIAFLVIPPGIMFFITQPGMGGESLFDLLKYYRKWSFHRKLYLNLYEGSDVDR